MTSPPNFDFYKPYDKNGMYATGGSKAIWKKRKWWKIYLVYYWSLLKEKIHGKV